MNKFEAVIAKQMASMRWWVVGTGLITVVASNVSIISMLLKQLDSSIL